MKSVKVDFNENTYIKRHVRYNRNKTLIEKFSEKRYIIR